MATLKCKKCGTETNQIAKFCQSCGASFVTPPSPRMRGCLVVLGAIGLLCVALIILGAILGPADPKGPSGTGAVASPATTPRPAVVATAPSAAALPEDEQAFCKIVSGYAEQYKQAKSNGDNELRLSQVRIARKRDLLSGLAHPAFRDWVGELESMKTTGEGKAYVSVKLPCNVTIKTWNNELSDIADGTLIGPDSAVYAQLAALKEGGQVKVSGTMFKSPQDGAREASMSEEGSMEEPEFIFRFSNVNPM